MEAFFRTHKYLVDHLHAPVRRGLMDEIDWSQRLIGIKGSRGVGKTTFLLDYARERYGADNKECLYVNLNHFYFTERTLADFAEEFRAKGGKVLLIDQVFKYKDWSRELRYCYDHLKDLRIVFSGSSVMRLKEENPDLAGKVASYNLRGFSFREYLNLMANTRFPALSLEEVLKDHGRIARAVGERVKPMAYFQDYLHHGFYPFFLEKRNFSENLLKTMNMTLEVDVLEKKPVVQTEVGNTQIERIIHAVDKVICLSNYTFQYLSCHHYPMEKVVHIPNGLIDEYKELSVMEKGRMRKQMGFSEDETLFLFVGRLMEAKGIFALMKAFKRIASQEPKARLLVVGSGDYESCFRERFPYCSQITLMGKMAKEELYQLYQICDVGVHPSLDEQCSYVAIEMMMHRLPMIGTDATGMNEMIEEGHNGYKVFIGEERNPDILEEKFYQGLMRCIQDKASWSILGANARCLYQSTYSLEIMKNRMAQAYFCNVEP